MLSVVLYTCVHACLMFAALLVIPNIIHDVYNKEYSLVDNLKFGWGNTIYTSLQINTKYISRMCTVIIIKIVSSDWRRRPKGRRNMSPLGGPRIGRMP